MQSTPKRKRKRKILGKIHNTPFHVATVVVPANTDWNSISLPVRNSGVMLLAKDFSFLQCCTWSISGLHLWSASFLHLYRTWPPLTSLFPPTLPPSATRCPLRKWLITITSGSGSHHLILLHTRSPSPPSQPSIPGYPPVLSLCFFFPCSTLQEINVAVRPFIYLERRRRWEGMRRTTAAPDIFGLIINMRHWLCIRIAVALAATKFS